jgi:CheY-like chemotaxis protein
MSRDIMKEKFNFLIIDDSQPVLKVYSQLLEKSGHETHLLTSADNALQHIINLKPDCILCDLLLPGIDGLDLFQQIKNERNINRPVFILISSKHYDYDKRQASKSGVDAYLTKPIDVSTFVDFVIDAIKSKIKTEV